VDQNLQSFLFFLKRVNRENARKKDRGVFFALVRCALRNWRVDFCPLRVSNVVVFSSSFPPLLGVDVTPFSLFRVFLTLLCASRNSPLIMLLSLSLNLMIIIITRLNVLCCCCCFYYVVVVYYV